MHGAVAGEHRLVGPREARGQVELFHPSASQAIEPLAIEPRFDVTEAKPAVAKSTESKPEPPPAAPAGTPWLDVYEDPKVRRVFAHIATSNGASQR